MRTTNDRAFVADQPRLLVEVLSPSTRETDTFGKLEEYKALPDPTRSCWSSRPPRALLCTRGADGNWAYGSLGGLERQVELPSLGVILPLSENYADLSFPPEEPQ